jgi:cysteine desulfurase
VAELIGATPEEIVFTSGGTESIAMGIGSIVEFGGDRRHAVTTTVEHSAVHEYFERLEKSGYEVTRVEVDSEGIVDLEELRSAIRPGDTSVVSVMWANNETGVISPMREIATLCADAGVAFHSDAVQAAGKLEIRVKEAGAEMLALSGHKMHGPKGVGALYVKRGMRFRPMLVGGGQENDRRSGTENVPGIVGLGAAASLLREELENGRKETLTALRDRFEEKILSELSECSVNGARERRLSNTSNLYFEGVDAEALLMLLDERGVCCSPGSACTTGAFEPSRVILAMGHPEKRARSSVRFSFSTLNTLEEAEEAAGLTVAAARKIRELRPSGGGPVVVHTQA